MPIAPGSRLGPYEILSPIGAGGMGEVYKAKDTRLDRTVAIKVLPEHLSNDPERRERFEREARAVSSLNHPHICTLHEFDTQTGIDYIVMEYIEGETLADRLSRGPLPLEQALEYGIQIADGLDKAHRHGVIHRDLKPGNMMLTKPGVKLLDFGLAKASPTHRSLGEGGSDALTRQKPLTDAGAILGTVQYMSPEQLEGKEADARSDLFAFGTVLYEMLTGRKAFEGESQASLITAIMSSEPPSISERQPMSPRFLDHVVTKCLEKDPEDRWQTARDLMDELKWIANGSGSETETSQQSRRAFPLVVASVVLTGLVASFAIWALEPEATRPVMRFDVALPADESLLSRPALALSPDGTRLAYATTRQLYLRSRDSVEATPIPSSEGTFSPFFSPDGEWLGFFTSAELKKVSVRGGTPVSVAQVMNGMKATWGADGNIVLGRGDGLGLWKVPASGGRIEALTTLTADEGDHGWPELLPGGESLLFAIRRQGSAADDSQIVVQSLTNGERKILVDGGRHPHYVSTGHLIYTRAPTLWAVPFDLDRLEVRGEAFPVAEGVMMMGRGAAQFSVSDEGTLIYASGKAGWDRIVWVDRDGRSEPAVENVDNFFGQRISPDGRHIAVAAHPLGSSHDIWIYDIDRGTRWRLTTSSHNDTPVWTPDGQRVTFASQRAGTNDLYWKPVDAGAEAEPLLITESAEHPTSWHPDGSVLAYDRSTSATGDDVWLLPRDGDPIPWLATEADEHSAMFSPDGRFIAYVSNESGRDEVYVRAHPESGARFVVSTDGGVQPVWSLDGRELFYRSGDVMLSVAVRSATEFAAGNPEFLFEHREHRYQPSSYDVTRDGQHFLMLQEQEDAPTEFHVVLNWFEELKRLAPTE